MLSFGIVIRVVPPELLILEKPPELGGSIMKLQPIAVESAIEIVSLFKRSKDLLSGF
jgi:hypothetical protein